MRIEMGEMAFEGTIEEISEWCELNGIELSQKQVAKDGPLKVGDYVKSLPTTKGVYSVTNEKMTLGKVVDVFDDEDIRVKVVVHEGNEDVGVDFGVGARYFRKATDEEVAEALKASEEAKAELARSKFAKGDKVRLISGGGIIPLSGYRDGNIYEVDDNSFPHRRGTRIRITGGEVPDGYATPDQLEKVSEKELLEIEAKESWAKIGRKPNEFKKGDIVRVGTSTSKYFAGRIVEVMLGPIGRNSGGNYRIKVGGEVETVLGCHLTLVAPVESVFSLSQE